MSTSHPDDDHRKVEGDNLPIEATDAATATPATARLSRRFFMHAAAVSAGAVATGGLARDALAKPKFDTPTIDCTHIGAREITLTVCAGVSGAPAGFSVQWVKHSDYPDLACDGGTGADWPPSDLTQNLCKASFSGTPRCSIYNLAANACVEVEIGNLLDSECGVGLHNCGFDELECNTEYVFRAFAHANSTKNRSDFTANLCCTTIRCIGDEGGCTLTQGYWKTHACDWPAPFAPGAQNTAPPEQCGTNGSNPNSSCLCDNTHTILIGSIAYTQCELLCAYALPGQGNALRILAHQLITAKLNVLNGATPPDCSIASADALIGSNNILTGVVGSQTTFGQLMIAAADCLDDYNNGITGPGHCS